MNDDSRNQDTIREAVWANQLIEPLSVGSDRTRVNLEVKFQGRDILLLVTGGEAHVGAVAVWDSRIKDGQATVTELPGHREGPLAVECAEILGHALGRTVVAVVGIHQDNATREEIAAIVANVRKGVLELAENKGTSDD
jgi:hypothetical protein